MMKIVGRLGMAVVLIGLGFILRGFMPTGGPPPGMMGMGEMPPPAVVAVELKEAPLDVRTEYIASIEPVQEVMVRTEVSGYIEAIHFREGAVVNEGDLLISIDPKPYQAMVEVRKAELASAQAELTNAEKYLRRVKEAGGRSISQSDVDRAEAMHLKAVAGIKQAEANLNLAQIDLDYAEIRAPISGRIGAARMTKGNYVDTSSGALARIIQMDPVRVVFSMTDRAYLDIRQKVQAGEVESLDAQVKLPNGTVLPMIGKLDFQDNAMNADTGTLAIRYLFDNPAEMLVSGGYVTLMLGRSDRPMGIRIPQKAVLVDQDGSYVLTATEEGQIGVMRVALGKTIGTDIEVVSGLNAGDRVVVEGVQKVQPGMPAMVTLLEAAQ